MSSEQCPTVKVKAENTDGFAVINEADFDPAVHELADGEKVPAGFAPKASAYAKLSVPELANLCDERGIMVPDGTRKAGLVALLEESE